jgi:hypothetical protein
MTNITRRMNVISHEIKNSTMNIIPIKYCEKCGRLKSIMDREYGDYQQFQNSVFELCNSCLHKVPSIPVSANYQNRS